MYSGWGSISSWHKCFHLSLFGLFWSNDIPKFQPIRVWYVLTIITYLPLDPLLLAADVDDGAVSTVVVVDEILCCWTLLLLSLFGLAEEEEELFPLFLWLVLYDMSSCLSVKSSRANNTAPTAAAATSKTRRKCSQQLELAYVLGTSLSLSLPLLCQPLLNGKRS